MVIYLRRTFCVSKDCTCGQKFTDELMEQIKNNEIDIINVQYAYLCGQDNADRSQERADSR